MTERGSMSFSRSEGSARFRRALLPLLALLLVGSPARAEDVVEVVITDAVGNIRVITDDHGNVLERHDYLPFGEECTTGPCAANPGVGAGQPRKFTGKERDQETGLDYFGARYYRANTGRFTTVDPVYTWRENLLDPQRWNRYTYARNNPLRYIDPNGEQVAEAIRQWGQQAQGFPDQRAVAIGGALIIVAANLDKLGDIGEAIIESGALNATQPGYPGVDIGMDRKMSGFLFNKKGGETPFTKAGRRAHQEEPLPEGFERESRLPSGRRMDGYNAADKKVIELKPNNPKATRRGQKQVEGYCKECDQEYGPGHTGSVQPYDPTKYLEKKQ